MRVAQRFDLSLQLGDLQRFRADGRLQLSVVISQSCVGAALWAGCTTCGQHGGKNRDQCSQHQQAGFHELAGNCSTTRSISPYSCISVADSQLLRSHVLAMASMSLPVPSTYT